MSCTHSRQLAATRPSQRSDPLLLKGPADEKERYYRIVWFDQAPVMRSAIMPTAALWPLLPPARHHSGRRPPPGKLPLSVRQRSLTNTGNATLRILAYGPCLKPPMVRSVKRITT